MAIITDRVIAEGIIQDVSAKKVPIAMFCTASTWNNEAILMAVQRYGIKHGIKNIPVIVGMTGSYTHFPQCKRVTRAKDLKTGFLSLIQSLKVLTGYKSSPYYDVLVLPQLDHGDPEKDRWIFTEGAKYLACAMFDCQRYPFDQNIEMTKEYVKNYGNQLLIEAAIDTLSISDGTRGPADMQESDDEYVKRAVEYVNTTGVDFLVADLGTEQQSTGVGGATYLKNRATSLTKALGKDMLVLHGMSSLTHEQMKTLGNDGVIKTNMWTRIVREAGQYAAAQLMTRMESISKGTAFDDIDPQTYINHCTEKAAGIMEDVLDLLNYNRLGC